MYLFHSECSVCDGNYKLIFTLKSMWCHVDGLCETAAGHWQILLLFQISFRSIQVDHAHVKGK